MFSLLAATYLSPRLHGILVFLYTFMDLYRSRWHSQRLVRRGFLSHSLFSRLIAPYKTIAFAIRSVDRLIPLWGFGVGWLGVAIHLKNSIALAIRSLDRYPLS